MKKPLRNPWFYAVLALLAAGGWWFTHSGGDTKSAANAVRVTVAAAARRDVPVEVKLVGNIVPYETVAVKSRLDAQQIVKVDFHDGDYVAEGQTLFELDDRTIRADIKQMEASLAKEKATLVNSKLQYDRDVKLVASNAVSQAAVDEAKAAYGAQAAQVGVAQANLDAARVQLTYAVITAPISGRSGTISVTRGNTVKANDVPLVTINQIKPIRAQFSIPQRYYEQVKAAMRDGEVNAQATNKDLPDPVGGNLEYLDNNINVGTGTFMARAAFANEDEKLWPGMFVTISLALGLQKNALTIPAVAVQGDEGNRFVFAVDAATKKAVRKPIEIGLNDGNIAVVTKGLDEGDQVVTDGILRVSDGAAVEIAEPAAEKKNVAP